MTKTLRILTTAMLLFTTLAAASVPVAQAHTCDSVDPATACGGCPSGEAHAHYYSVNDRRVLVYCQSPGPTTIIWDLLNSDAAA